MVSSGRSAHSRANHLFLLFPSWCISSSGGRGPSVWESSLLANLARYNTNKERITQKSDERCIRDEKILYPGLFPVHAKRKTFRNEGKSYGIRASIQGARSH